MKRKVLVAICGVLALLAASSHATVAESRAVAAEPIAVLNDPFSARQQTGVPWGSSSHWLQPWRGYLDTPPATKLLDSVGINADATPARTPALARLLRDSGFRRARFEFGWVQISYDDPTSLNGNGQAAAFRQAMIAFRDNGIRPLILLNAHQGAPCPLRFFSATITQPAQKGDRQLVLDAATAAKVVPGHTGLNSQTAYRAADTIFTSISGQTVTLSKPLPQALSPGAYPAATLKYVPFGPPKLPDGSPNPDFEQTMAGWLSYTGTVAREAKAVLGSDNFDVEVWNELTFGSDYLSQTSYYDPAKTPGAAGFPAVTTEILKRTVRYLRDPANGVAGIGIGDGFANTLPWQAGSTSPPGLSAINKHPYSSAAAFPAAAASANPGIRPVDAFGGTAGRQVGGIWRPFFTPRYTSMFPEYFLTAIQTENFIRDISPITTEVYGTPHGRYTHPPGAAPPGMWVTEWNLDTSSAALSDVDRKHVQAKAALRFLVSWVNKGVSAVDFYSATGGDLALVDPSFFAAVDRGGGAYPGVGLGGPTMDAMRRLTQSVADATRIAKPMPLSLRSIGDFTGRAQFKGDGTLQRPTLYDRDTLGFFPFQVTDSSWAIPMYVMTRNILQAYRSGTDVNRFDMPDEKFRLKIGGLPNTSLTVTATDPMSGQSVPATVVNRAGDQLTVDVPLTDSPRVLMITSQDAPASPPAASQAQPPGSQAFRSVSRVD